MHDAIHTLRRVSPEIVAAALIGADGEVEATSADAELEDALGPSTTTLTTIAARVVQELGRGALELSVLEGTFGRVLTVDVGDGRTLIAIARPSAQLGLLLEDVRACGETLRGGLHA